MATTAAGQPPYAQVPVLDMGPSVACLIANIIIPGLGTLIAGIMGSRPMVGRAIAQFLLEIIIVGWIWGIVTGVQLLTNSSWKDKQSRAASA